MIFQWFPHAEMEQRLAEGWQLGRNAVETHHHHYAVVMFRQAPDSAGSYADD